MKYRKTCLFVSLTLLLSAIVGPLFAIDRRPENAVPTDAFAELQRKVVKLEARVAMLEKQTRIVTIPSLELHRSHPRLRGHAPQDGAVPRIVNGNVYYIVPLSRGQ